MHLHGHNSTVLSIGSSVPDFASLHASNASTANNSYTSTHRTRSNSSTSSNFVTPTNHANPARRDVVVLPPPPSNDVPLLVIQSKTKIEGRRIGAGILRTRGHSSKPCLTSYLVSLLLSLQLSLLLNLLLDPPISWLLNAPFDLLLDPPLDPPPNSLFFVFIFIIVVVDGKELAGIPHIRMLRD
ncbi:hypothetical protein HDK90DRAFT_470128 [Phyllosticta capitalensis]|uniref:Uncharacterized protein n=1 Tax=Phyllosticta capitalensis TaxID=121624 RepID=A0ABR1YB93_9PEZI